MTVPIGDDDNDGEDNRPFQSAHDLPLEQREHQRRIVRVRRCVHAQGVVAVAVAVVVEPSSSSVSSSGGRTTTRRLAFAGGLRGSGWEAMPLLS